jgi:hypothetical protein
MDDGHAMNFSLKRKAGADARPKRPRGGGAFGGDSDSDSPDPEQQFKQAIAAKTTAAEIETARAALQTEVAAEAAQAPPARTQDAPRLVSRILEAKRVRQQEQRAAQLMHDEAKLQQYLKENQDALVFASDAYTRQQEEVRVLERQRLQHDAAAAAAAPSQSFYAKMIRAQAGEPPESGPPQESGPPAQAGGATGTDPSDGEAHARPSGAVTSPAAEVSALAAASAAAAASASASEAAPAASAAAAALTPALSRRIRSTVTPQDIEEAKEKYWQRKAGHID